MTRASQIIGIVALMLMPVVANGQQLPSPQEAAKHGAVVYAASCTGYCHGANGAVGTGAPALAGRGLDAAYIDNVVMHGIPGTAMPGWGQRIPVPDSYAVIAYVQSLNGLIQATNVVPLRDLPPEAQRGSALFFDTQGDFTGCSNCHEMNGKGLPVAHPIANVPADVQALRNLATPKVSTATVGGRSFPALVVTQIRGETRLYDMSALPPVLLTLSPADVKIANGSSWQHSSALGTLKDEELQPILAFLRALQRP
jgi:cytochrome c553